MRGEVSRATRPMSDKFFLDTNIFVYCFDKSSPKKADRASKLIGQALETRRGIVSYHVVFELALKPHAGSLSLVGATLIFWSWFLASTALKSASCCFCSAFQAARVRL